MGGMGGLGSSSSGGLGMQQQQAFGLCKSRTGYVGLKNLGCICYMNSTMQQFFHVERFREGLLAFEVDPEEEKEESLMYQLQSLFAHLQETDKAYYNPKGFCHALKNWEGEPTDVFIQEDASDFLLKFFQEVEGLTQGTPCETVLKEAFGGTYVHELIAEGGKYRARPEAFYFITVPVKNIRTLDEALSAFIAEEVLTDFSWEIEKEGSEEVVKEQLPTVKRISLQSLPRHLFLHLKRFEFDYETMQQIKINDRLEFPEELDMRPYTLEGRREMEKAQAQQQGGNSHHHLCLERGRGRGRRRRGRKKKKQHLHTHLIITSIAWRGW